MCATWLIHRQMLLVFLVLAITGILCIYGMIQASSSYTQHHDISEDNLDWKQGAVRSPAGKFTLPWTDAIRLPPPLELIAKWKLQFAGPAYPSDEDSVRMFPRVKPDWSQVMNSDDELSITWVGHSTCYVKMAGGMRVLTDPVFSHRITPFPWFSPTRYVPVPFEILEMPMPHTILISHDHFDHLDAPSIRAIEAEVVRRDGGDVKPVYMVGLGLAGFMRDEFGIDKDRIFEFDWWQSLRFTFNKQTSRLLLDDPTGELPSHSSVQVMFLPSQHWSGRATSSMRTLWGGFHLLDSASQSFYYVGDTGWNPSLFSHIASRIAPVDLAVIPIGAYKPRWFMRPQHVSPKEAQWIHEAVQSKFSVGVHWGTFILTDEPLLEPKNKLEAIRDVLDDDGTQFITIAHGQTISPCSK